MDPSLSIVLPLRNAQARLERLVVEQLDVLPEVAAGVQWVLVDDGSDDATNEVAYDLACRYPQVRSIDLPQRLGLSFAWARGLREAAGRIILLGNPAWFPQADDTVKLIRQAQSHEVVFARAWETMTAPAQGDGRAWDPPPVVAVWRELAAELVSRLPQWSDWMEQLRARGAHCAAISLRAQPLAALPDGPAESICRWDAQPQQAGQPAGRPKPPVHSPGRPKRPNYLRLLKDFARGE